MSPRPPALRLIIAYKLGRAALSLVAAVVLLGLVLSGAETALHGFAVRVNEHANTVLAQELSRLSVSALAPPHIWVALLALFIDGAVVLLEGWALHRGWRWGPWLVVAMTAALLPFEVAALLRHVATGRVALLLVNALIVAYLLWLRWRERP